MHVIENPARGVRLNSPGAILDSELGSTGPSLMDETSNRRGDANSRMARNFGVSEARQSNMSIFQWLKLMGAPWSDIMSAINDVERSADRIFASNFEV